MSGWRHLLIAVFTIAAAPYATWGVEPKEPDLPVLHTIHVPNGVAGLSFSADGRVLLTLGKMFSADGSKLVVPGNEIPRLWDVSAGKQLTGFDPSRGVAQLGIKGILQCNCVTSPDGRMVALEFSAEGPHDDLYVLILDADSGKLLQPLHYRRTSVGWMRFSPNSRTVAICGGDNHVRTWDVASGKIIGEFPLSIPVLGNRGYGSSFGAFSPDGKTIAADLEEGSILLFDMTSGKETGKLVQPVGSPPRHGHYHKLAYSSNGRFLATAGDGFDPMVRVWSIAAKKVVYDFTLIPPPVEPPGSPRGIWLPPPLPGPTSLDFSPDSKTIVVGCSDHKVRLYESATGKLRREIDFAGDHVRASPRAPLLAMADEQGTVSFTDWRATKQHQLKPFGPEQEEGLWRDLAVEDASVAWRPVTRLIAAPDDATEFLAERLKPVQPLPPGELERLVVQLDDSSFDAREAANHRLAILAEQADDALRRALAHDPSPELSRRAAELLARLDAPPDAQRLRELRAVEVLEAVGGPEAKRQLRKLMEGAAGAVLTEDARAALQRLNTD